MDVLIRIRQPRIGSTLACRGWRWNLKAFVLVNVRAGKSPEVLAALQQIDAVRIAHACWGRPDIFALVEVRNERALGNLVLEKVQSIAGIESTDTHIVIG